MKGPASTVGIFLTTAVICAVVTFALGWRSVAGIIVTAAGAGIAVAIATRGRGGPDR